jgi:hypothetical protein
MKHEPVTESRIEDDNHTVEGSKATDDCVSRKARDGAMRSGDNEDAL